MKILISILFLACICTDVRSQKSVSDTSRTCLQVATELSYYWKLDSLANNGFRRYTYKKFVDSKPGIIYADVLLNKLGKPNEVWKTNKGTEYIYYCFDINKMPKNYNGPKACWYVSFKFESEQNYLSSVEEGDIDR